MRFCTSELKLAPIASALKRRYPHLPILNVSGIRRQESPARSQMPIAAIEPRLLRRAYAGATWNPIIEWTLEDVLAEIGQSGLRLHEAYTRYGSSRVSCAFCIMSSAHDLIAAASCSDNHDVYCAMVELEVVSSFAFQGKRWLADVAPHLLGVDLRARVPAAKRIAELRRQIESEIPTHLFYTKGWPTAVPTLAEAEVIAHVRRRLSELLQLEARYLTGKAVRYRYMELIAEKRRKEAMARRDDHSRRRAA